jgi:DNA replication protein DnaC
LAYIRFEIGEKEAFDEIINQISDKQQLVILLSMFSPFRGKEKIDYDQFSREELLVRLDEARENRVELKRKHI